MLSVAVTARSTAEQRRVTQLSAAWSCAVALHRHEANGIPVFDPHTHILEDGGMKQTDWAQLGFKRRVDPLGLLNPGKMRAWEEQAAASATRRRGRRDV